MKQVRIGVVGVTGRGRLWRHWHNPEGKSIVAGGADISEDALQEFKNEIKEKTFTTLDYKELLKRRDIDAIAITSPDFTHEEYAIAALEAGKHVYLEKPMAITTEGCDNILKAWKQSGKRLMVGFNMRHMRIFQTMKDIADTGTIGEIKAVWVRHFVGYGGRWYFRTWMSERKNATSLLLQKAAHDIDMIHWIAGSYTRKVAAFGSLDFYGGNKPNDLTCPECPEKETCTEFKSGKHKYIKCAFRKAVDVEDNTVMIMELENGIKASYEQCHFTPDYWRNYTFIGTEGRMENLDDKSRVIVKTRRSGKWKEFADRTYDIKPVEGGHGGADPVICKDFVEMLLTGKDPVSTPEAGRMSVATGCAATESLRNGGRVVKISPMPALR
ncbi:MAG: Gfo/Idh/MocA family oxidoreductase [bacterium]